MTERIVEQIADEKKDHARAPQTQEQILEVALDLPQERVQQRTTEQVVDASRWVMPQNYTMEQIKVMKVSGASAAGHKRPAYMGADQTTI